MKKPKCLIFSHVKRLLLDCSLKVKMVAILLVLLLLPSCFFIQYASQCVASILQEQTFSSTQKAFDETLSLLENNIEKTCAVMEHLVYDERVHAMVSTKVSDYPYAKQLEDMRALSGYLRSLIELSGVENIQLYVGDDYLYANENKNIFPLSTIYDCAWYSQLLSQPGGIWISGRMNDESADVYSYVRLIFDPSNLNVPLAVLCVDLSGTALERTLSRAATTRNAVVLLQFGEGEEVLLSASNEAVIPLPETLASVLSQTEEKNWSLTSVDDVPYYLYDTVLTSTGWQLAVAIPHADIYGVSTSLRTEMTIVMVLAAGIAYVIALILSNLTLKRIWELANTMQRVEDGNVDEQFVVSSNDEIGQLITHFNRMMARIRDLMTERVMHVQKLKNSELKALQAQINPHFLYNTLDAISCIAIQKNVPEIVDIVSSLADFYRVSLSRGRDQIPIRDEIRHARAYINILNARFGNRIHVKWAVDPQIEDYLIVKIVLQPIIENAVFHGICERDDETGTLTIQGWQDGGELYLTVADDGVGMSKTTLEGLFVDSSALPDDASAGYGLRNIYDRLRITYGERYGLSCHSIPNVGTTVTIHIPAI